MKVSELLRGGLNVNMVCKIVQIRHQLGVHTIAYLLLDFAIKDGFVDIAELLLDHGAHVDAAGFRGNTSLITASQNGHEDSVTLLLARGANVKASDADGMTALHYAARNCEVGVVRILVKNKAIVNALSRHGSTPLCYSIPVPSICITARSSMSRRVI